MNRQFPNLRRNYRTNCGLIYIYDHPTHTDLAKQIFKYKYSTPTLRTATTSRSFKRTINRMLHHYILLWHLENSSPEYTRVNTTKYTWPNLPQPLSIFSSHERNIDMLWAAQTWEGGAARCRRWTRLWPRFPRSC